MAGRNSNWYSIMQNNVDAFHKARTICPMTQIYVLEMRLKCKNGHWIKEIADHLPEDLSLSLGTHPNT